jgi:hypothetical protein
MTSSHHMLNRLAPGPRDPVVSSTREWVDPERQAMLAAIKDGSLPSTPGPNGRRIVSGTDLNRWREARAAAPHATR